MNLPIFQVPSCSAFSSSKMWLSNFSSGSRQRPQLATGTMGALRSLQVLGLSGCHCRSKAAMPRLDTLVSIHSSAIRSALSQCGAVTMCCPLHRRIPQLLSSTVGCPGPRVGVTARPTRQRLGHIPCKSLKTHTKMPNWTMLTHHLTSLSRQWDQWCWVPKSHSRSKNGQKPATAAWTSWLLRKLSIKPALVSHLTASSVSSSTS